MRKIALLLLLLPIQLLAADLIIEVQGRGGHGAYPHTTIDPIVLGAQIIVATKTLLPNQLPRHLRPGITIHSINGGTKRNIIPPKITLEANYTVTKRSHRFMVQRALQKLLAHLGRAASLEEDEYPIIKGLRWRRRKARSRRREPQSPDKNQNSLLAEPKPSKKTPLLKLINKNQKELIKFYKELHANPELSFQEEKTAARVARELRKIGVEVTEKIGGHGVVGLLENGPGPIVMVRADMDALPIKEQTGAAFSSTVTAIDEKGNKVPVMHACGHDVHTSCLIGTTKTMAKLKNKWSGTLLIVGQPAEERGRGAKAMLADGLFEKFPRPDYCLAQHCDASLRAGKVGYHIGYYNATLSSADLTFHGQASLPTAANVILALQKIVARRLDPTVPGVVTVGKITTTKTLDVTLELTIRARERKVWQQIIHSIEEIATNVGKAGMVPGGKEPTLWIGPQGAPATINDETLVRRAIKVWTKAYGPQNLVTGKATMGGDDFGYFGDITPKIPLFYWRLGAAQAPKAGKKSGALHSPYFLPDVDKALRSGVYAMTTLLLDLLARE